MTINVMKAFPSFNKLNLCRQIQHKLVSIILIVKRKKKVATGYNDKNMKKNKKNKQKIATERRTIVLPHRLQRATPFLSL